MAPTASNLPTRFPCWCKAIYSWGGETKRDLGFMEGDLIECLNAGDGSWWMGRLRRDKRMLGLFPSNFVQVLPEGFQPGPVSRNTSPLPATSPATKPAPQKTKSVFRKPFTAYAAAGSPNPTAAAREVQQKSGSLNTTPTGSINKHRPYSSMKRSSIDQRTPSPAPLAPQPSARSHFRAVSPRPTSRSGFAQPHSRTQSPLPPSFLANATPHSRVPSPAPSFNPYTHSRVPSPAPPHQYQAYSRTASPAPFAQANSGSRVPSPAPFVDHDSPPPPPPPPHRVAYNPSRAPSPQPHRDPRYGNGYHTPEPAPSPEHRNFTPSPLTNAMNDVMSSLQDMGMTRRSPTPEEPRTPSNVWSPEAFNQIYTASARKIRPQSSMGFTSQQDSGYVSGEAYPVDPKPYRSQAEELPMVQNYVQRMEDKLRKVQSASPRPHDELFLPADDMGPPPVPPPKNSVYQPRPQSSHSSESEFSGRMNSRRSLKNRKSAYELGRAMLDRTFTTKTNTTTSTAPSTSTNSSSATARTDHSLMSGHSAGAFSATSAGSLARRKWGLGGSTRGRPMSAMGAYDNRSQFGLDSPSRPETPFTGVTYHSSHDSRQGPVSQTDWTGNVTEAPDLLGGLAAPKAKKSGFFKKMIESAKTGAASARSTISSGSNSRPASPHKSLVPNGMTAIAGGTAAPRQSAARDMGLGGGVDWVQVRRDVNRSNSLSKNERNERADRCQMMDIAVINPVDVLYETAEGDEGLDGLPISESTDFTACNLGLVDKSARFINSIPPMTNPTGLAQGYVCRPYRSDVQRLRAIFTWVSERISWEEDFEGEVDTRRVIQTKRGCSEEISVLVMEMCAAVGLHAEVVRGYLKAPGEILDLDMMARPNHWWNAVIVDGEWRIIDCSLASPTNPKRSQYSGAGSQVAEGWWFLARPMEICYTHVPLLPEQQHICPPLPHEILMALPCACPPYFKNGLQVVDFDTSLLNLENLELAHIHFTVPEDVECVAEVEARAFAQDADGDFFESGEMVRKRALAQAEWVGGQKRYTMKALLPGDEGQGVLKVYAGKRGLMHSIKSNPHPLAFALPLTHTGTNPPYDFLTLHPTPHAQRHDLYVAQPQCARLAVNNTFVFAVRQHPSSRNPDHHHHAAGAGTTLGRAASPNPFARPASAMSMASISVSGSAYSNPSNASSSSANSSGQQQQQQQHQHQKPAKLAVQSPSGKIIRLVRKAEHMGGSGGEQEEEGDGGTWETVIKIGERGTWRGLVLADRSARWCVFAEWEGI